MSATNEALDVYYASSNTSGVPYPAFSHNERVTDVSHNGNCRMFGGGTAAFTATTSSSMLAGMA